MPPLDPAMFQKCYRLPFAVIFPAISFADSAACPQAHPHVLHPRHPAGISPANGVAGLGQRQAFRLSDALTGVCVFGATGSGKTTGPAKHLAYGYLAADFGGLVLCAKKEERRQWQKWAPECGRTDDLVIVDATGKWRFNFLEWEASRPDEGGGLTINIVAILDEIAGAIAKAAGKAEGGGGDNKFWEDALHHMNTNLVDLPVFAGLRVSLPLMRSIVSSAPQSLAQIADEKWQEHQRLRATFSGRRTRPPLKASDDVRADFEECRNYWLQEYPGPVRKNPQHHHPVVFDAGTAAHHAALAEALFHRHQHQAGGCL